MKHDIDIVRIWIQRVRPGITRAELTEVFREVAQVIAAGRYEPGGPFGHRLMELAVRHAERLAAGAVSEEVDYDLAMALLNDDFEARDRAMALVNSDPELRRVYAELVAQCDPALIPVATLHLILDKDGMTLFDLPVDCSSPIQSIADAKPGRYRLSLSNDRVLWEADVEFNHLLSRLAFPAAPTALAASTDEIARPGQWSLKHRDLGGIASVTVYPGLEAGRIEVEITRGHRGGHHAS